MRKIFLSILFFAMAGLIASAIMTKMHFDLAGGGFEQKSFCNISDFVDCDTVLASSYAKIAGIPTAQLGILYYLFLLLATLYGWAASGSRKKIFTFLLAGASFAILYSLVMAYLSFFRLEALCLLCLTTYIANLFLLFLIPAVLEIRVWKIPAYLLSQLRPLFGVPLVLFLLLMGGGVLFFKGMGPRLPPHGLKLPNELYLKSFQAAEPASLGLEEVTSRGPADAKVTIVEFSDFQCPFCRRAAFTLKPYLGEYRNKIRFVYINYPLDNSCNPAVTHAMHPVSCLAAKAALCAGSKNKFWEYHDLVFENQKRLSRSLLLELAKQVGLEEDWFNVCLVSGEIEARLSREIEEGKKFDVRGTPALYINGRPFRDWMDPERLQLVMEASMREAAQP